MIDTLHNKAPKGVEWGGLIAYKIHAGDILRPEDLNIEVVGLVPANIGSSALTEYKPAEHMLDFNDAYPNLNIFEGGYLFGAIHTHHSMGAYFSATDKEDLKRNSQNGYYLSLIVDYKGEYVAKLATNIKRKKDVVSYITNYDGTVTEKVSTEESNDMLSVDLKVIRPVITITTPSWFNDKLSTLNTEYHNRKKPVYHKANTSYKWSYPAKESKTLKVTDNKSANFYHAISRALLRDSKTRMPVVHAAAKAIKKEDEEALSLNFVSDFFVYYFADSKETDNAKYIEALEKAGDHLEFLDLDAHRRGDLALEAINLYLSASLDYNSYDDGFGFGF
jgi:hypothetical protein